MDITSCGCNSCRVPQGRLRRRGHLAASLIKRPRDIPRYLQYSLPLPSPLDVELPWLAFGAIDFLDAHVAGGTIYEYGGGGSTLFFARRADRVVTVEHDPRWATALQQAIVSRSLSNVEVIAAAADFNDPVTFGQSDFAHALPNDPADLVMLDSYDVVPPHALRPLLFPHAEDLVRKPGGFIVVDDSHRYPQLPHQSTAHEIHSFSGPGPGRRGVTTTDIHCY